VTKIAGSGTGSESVSQRYRSPYPDPYQNVSDPQYRFFSSLIFLLSANSVEDAMEACSRHVGRSRGRHAHYRSCYCCPSSVSFHHDHSIRICSLFLTASLILVSVRHSYDSLLKRMFSISHYTVSMKIRLRSHVCDVLHFFHYLICFKFLLKPSIVAA
jgi:hypothetical protein